MGGVLRRAVLGGLAAGCVGPGLAWARGRRPDLQGVWSLATYTDIERPESLHALVLTPAEAEAYEAPRRALNGQPPSPADGLGQAESEFNERGDGLARVRGEIHSSLVVDPPDGKIPFTPAGLAAVAREKAPRADNPEEAGGSTRCLTATTAGPPMVGGPDTNLFQIVQTPDAVVFFTEKYHDARIVRMARDGGGAAAPASLGPAPPPAWMGHGLGRWEGASLVVETAGFPAGVIPRGARLLAAGTTRVTERFTRVAPDELLYEWTVSDPVLYTRSWRGEQSIRRAKAPMFEYACHEGNYGLPNILAGARREQRDAAGR